MRIFLVFTQELKVFEDYRFFLLVLSTIFIAAGGYIINDYFDVKIDRINKPDKVWIGKIISRRNAQLLHQVLTGIGLLLALFVNWKITVIHAVSALLLWLYASGFKKKLIIGNLVIALLTAIVIVEIALVYDVENKLIYMYAVFAFFINLIREIIKDMEDVKGDEHHGAKTLPIVYGIYRTKKILYILMVLFLASLLFFMIKMYDHRVQTFSYVLVSIWAVLLFFLIRSDRKSHFTELSSLSKWMIIAGLFSVVLF